MNSIFGTLRTQIILAFALMLLGFGFVVQLRSFEQVGERLETESEADLVEIVDQLDRDISQIRGELLEKRLEVAEYRGANRDGQSLVADMKSDIASLRTLIGLDSASGKGIKIIIENKQELLTGFDIRQIVEELRASGAWALAINGRRLDNRSAFWRRSGNIYIDGLSVGPDLTIEAVGQKELLFQAIMLPRGINDKLSTLKGVTVNVEQQDQILLSPLRIARPSDLLTAGKQGIKQ